MRKVFDYALGHKERVVLRIGAIFAFAFPHIIPHDYKEYCYDPMICGITVIGFWAI